MRQTVSDIARPRVRLVQARDRYSSGGDQEVTRGGGGQNEEGAQRLRFGHTGRAECVERLNAQTPDRAYTMQGGNSGEVSSSGK